MGGRGERGGKDEGEKKRGEEGGKEEKTWKENGMLQFMLGLACLAHYRHTD